MSTAHAPVSGGRLLTEMTKHSSIPTFRYRRSELASKLANVALCYGGYVNVTIADNDQDPRPVRYFYRNNVFDNQSLGAAEVADNTVDKTHHLYRDFPELYSKMYALVSHPEFLHAELMEKATRREYEKIYRWQLLD